MGLRRKFKKRKSAGTILRGLLSAASINKVTQAQRDNTTLVMTLLIRNEADVIRLNLEHHFSQGVDYAVITDHLSVDGVNDVLEPYIQAGKVFLIREEEVSYQQALWVNRMGAEAKSRWQADMIFHCDADEFWVSETGNLKDELLAYPLIDCVQVKAENVLLEDKDGEEVFPDDAIYSVTNPILGEDEKEIFEEKSLYLLEAFEKVLFRVKGDEVPQVEMGNHRLDGRWEGGRQMVVKPSRKIMFYHYPIRGKAHFFRKVKEGAEALILAKNTNPGAGWHWRRWYKRLQEGTLDQAYRLHTVNSQSNEFLQKGIVERKSEMRDALMQLTK